jgi:hypothetical protein
MIYVNKLSNAIFVCIPSFLTLEFYNRSSKLIFNFSLNQTSRLIRPRIIGSVSYTNISKRPRGDAIFHTVLSQLATA